MSCDVNVGWASELVSLFAADPEVHPTGNVSPADFQFVGNLVDASYPAERFLGHLLLKERADSAAERHAAFASFEAQRSVRDVGVSFQGAGYAGFQGTGVDHGANQKCGGGTNQEGRAPRAKSRREVPTFNDRTRFAQFAT